MAGPCGSQTLGPLVELLAQMEYSHAHLLGAQWEEKVQWRPLASFAVLNGISLVHLVLDNELALIPKRTKRGGSAKAFMDILHADATRTPDQVMGTPAEAVHVCTVSQLRCELYMVEDNHKQKANVCGITVKEPGRTHVASLHQKNLEAVAARNEEHEGCGGHCDVTKLLINPTLFADNGELSPELPRSGRGMALMIGSGPSVNTLDEAQYQMLRKHVDVWGVNQLIYHNFVEPDYLHMEIVKDEQVPVWQHHLPEGKWKDTAFITEDGWRYWNDNVTGTKDRLAFTYRAGAKCLVQAHLHLPSCLVGHGRYRVTEGLVNAMCCSSINRVLDIATYMPYHTVARTSPAQSDMCDIF